MDLVVSEQPQLPATLIETAEKARDYVRESTAANTRRAYKAAWAAFADWCATHGLDPLPAVPSTVGLFLTDQAETYKVSTLRLRLSAISQAHVTAGYRLDRTDPAIRRVMGGIARTKGIAPTKKQALLDTTLRDCLRATAGDGAKAVRDRALLALAFFSATRRSEIVALDLSDVAFTPEGVVVTLGRRKTDQTGQGTQIAMPFKADTLLCPVVALQAWLAVRGTEAGPLFCSVARSGRVLDRRLSGIDVARIVKQAAERAGYDAAAFAAHSTRRGFITTAARRGVPERVIARQSGHKSINVLRGYVEAASLFMENAAALI